MSINLSFLLTKIEELTTLYLDELSDEINRPSGTQYKLIISGFKVGKIYNITKRRLYLLDLKVKLNKLIEEYKHRTTQLCTE